MVEVIEISVDNWLHVDRMTIVRSLALAARRLGRCHFSAKLQTPDFDRLRDYVAGQAERSPIAPTADEQRTAVAVANKRIAAIEKAAGELLRGVAAAHGVAAAARCCAHFLFIQLAITCDFLGRYQLRADNNVYDLNLEFELPAVIQQLYGGQHVVELDLVHRRHVRLRERVWIPENMQDHRKQREVWTDVVLPQYVGSHTWYDSRWRPWSGANAVVV